MDAKDEIKQRLSIEDVIGEYLELKRAGRNLKGLSPFTNEKTPSFMVSPEKQIWHDFSSNKGGDVFSFVMEVEGLDFRASLELLAQKAGVELTQFKGQGGGGKKKARLIEANELAAKFYQVHFSRHKPALDYVFKKRAFTKETALAFRLGYSPTSGTALLDFLKSKGFSEREITDAGLTADRRSGLGDMFRGRIMVPLQDAQGAVIGFTARLLENNDRAPKYINTPQTLVYNKSTHVYGLHLAKDAIRKNDRAIIAEGNLDVVASHQAGVAEVVATAGTAMTQEQIKTLSRFTADIRLAYDQDRAGIAATERAIPLADAVGVALKMVNMPDGKDPDELIQKDPNLWLRAVDDTLDAIDWLIGRYQASVDMNTQAGRAQFKAAVLQALAGVSSPGEQEVYVRKVADVLGYSADALQAELAGQPLKAAPKKRTTSAEKVNTKSTHLQQQKYQDRLLAICMKQPKLRAQLEPLTKHMFSAPEAQLLLEKLQNHDGELPETSEYDKILAFQYDELYKNLDAVELQAEVHRLVIRITETFVRAAKAAIAQKLANTPDGTDAELLKKAKALDLLLTRVKGGSTHASQKDSKAES